MGLPYGASIPTEKMTSEYVIFWNLRPMWMKDQPYVRVQIRVAGEDTFFIVLVNDEYMFRCSRDRFASSKAKRAVWHLATPDHKAIAAGRDPQVLVQEQIDLIESRL